MSLRGWLDKEFQVKMFRLGLVLMFVWMVRTWLWMPILIKGTSMMPTLQDGQLCGIIKSAYLLRSPRRGDLVAVWTGNLLIAKRIIGLPGDCIAIVRGVVLLNGSPLEETYVKYRDESTIAPGIVSPHCLVVAGDNRQISIVAVVRRSRIVGKVTLLTLRKPATAISRAFSGNVSSNTPRVSSISLCFFTRPTSASGLQQFFYVAGTGGSGRRTEPLPCRTCVAVMAHAREMFRWYAGSVDVYLCPKRHATYFGSFYMKDIPAVGNANLSISTSLTGDSGEAFLAALSASQRLLITGLVDLQRQGISSLRRSTRTRMLSTYPSGVL